MTDLGTYQKWS